MNINMFNEEMVNAMIAEAVEAERKVMQAKIETLYAMYEVAVKQRDYLMDQQRAQVEAMRGRVQ
jgi:polyhydroxyalkanoate synthesis regulator phasin